jgi:hypothetical protein
MPDAKKAVPTFAVWRQILTDIHFWVPAVVLLAGLAVLHWIR